MKSGQVSTEDRSIWQRYRWEILTGLFAACLLTVLGLRLLLTPGTGAPAASPTLAAEARPSP